jgi:hypothetical protein
VDDADTPTHTEDGLSTTAGAAMILFSRAHLLQYPEIPPAKNPQFAMHIESDVFWFD